MIMAAQQTAKAWQKQHIIMFTPSGGHSNALRLDNAVVKVWLGLDTKFTQLGEDHGLG